VGGNRETTKIKGKKMKIIKERIRKETPEQGKKLWISPPGLCFYKQ
jgi:hypothetical protein